MSIDKSLRRKNQLARARNVLTRAERVKVLMDEERWSEGRSPFGLPKVRVIKIVLKKAKKAKEEEKPTEGAAAGGALAAAGAAPAAGDKKGAGAAAKPAAAAAKPAAGAKPAAAAKGAEKKK